MDLTSGSAGAITGLLASDRAFAWLGIAVCLSQAAMFSGLNLAIFSVSRLRLEVESAGGNSDAQKVLALRQQSNLTLATILWGNVAVTVLFALLSGSVLAGGAAFAFSTIVITFFGEIVPQAYFSRNALRIAAGCTPLLRAYRILLFPVAGPSAWLLDWWLGPEAIALFRERDFKALIAKHIEAAECDVGHLEGSGALNFLDLDDLLVCHEGSASAACRSLTADLNCRPMRLPSTTLSCAASMPLAKNGWYSPNPPASPAWRWIPTGFCARCCLVDCCPIRTRTGTVQSSSATRGRAWGRSSHSWS